MSWEYHKPFLRQETCLKCKGGHGKGSANRKCGWKLEVLCKITKRWGNNERACYCPKFQHFYSAKLYYAPDGVPVRSRTSLDYRTLNQWYDANREVKDGAVGIRMHPISTTSKTYVYFHFDDTVPIKYEDDVEDNASTSSNPPPLGVVPR